MISNHDLDALQKAVTKERDDEKNRYREEVEKEERGEPANEYRRGIAFGAAMAHALVLDFLHTYTDGEYGQKLRDQQKRVVS